MENLIEDVLECISNTMKEQRFLTDDSNPVINQFRAANQSGKYAISLIPHSIKVYNTKVSFYALEGVGDTEISNSQVYNMNVNSGYSMTINMTADDLVPYDALTCNVFINKEFLIDNPKNFKESKTGKFLLNLRYLLLNIMHTAYPAMKDNFSNIAASVCAVVIANKLGLSITPTLIAHYFELNPQMGEMILDKYDYEKNKFIGVPWLF